MEGVNCVQTDWIMSQHTNNPRAVAYLDNVRTFLVDSKAAFLNNGWRSDL